METSLQVKRQLVLFEAEEWREIPGHEGEYEASSWGRVRSMDRIDRGGYRRKSKLLRMRPLNNKNPYPVTEIVLADGRGSPVLVHRLVALAFHGLPPTPTHQVNHIDGDKTNNRPENLEWVTPSQNIQHALNTLGRQFGSRGKKNGRAILTEDVVRELRSRYRPGVYGLVAQLAREFNVPYQAVYQALTGRSWTHL